MTDNEYNELIQLLQDWKEFEKKDQKTLKFFGNGAENTMQHISQQLFPIEASH